MTSLPDTSKGQRFADFVSLNRYYGWYVLGGAGLADAEAAFHHEMEGWAKSCMAARSSSLSTAPTT